MPDEAAVSKGHQQPADKSDSVTTRITDLESEVRRLRSMILQPSPYANPLLADINSTSNTFTESLINNGTVSAAISPPWRSGTYVDLSDDQAVLLQIVQDRVWFVRIAGGAPIPPASNIVFVNVSKTSGAPGSATTQCAYLYTVEDLDGNVLGTGVSPAMQRRNLGLTAEAHVGIAFYRFSSLVLWWVDEQPVCIKRVCP